MSQPATGFSIGKLAAMADVHVETIRFYQLKGLLLAPERHYGRIRRYRESDVARVRFIKSAQRIGFRLDEVVEPLKLEDGTHCDEASALATAKLTDVRRHLQSLKRMEKALITLVKACQSKHGKASCPLIESLNQ